VSTDLKIRENGPILIKGHAIVVDEDGNQTPVEGKGGTIALCRCGASANKPFCDGAHREIGFEAAPVSIAVE
jgi:CDGSH-type Zn-finger protein